MPPLAGRRQHSYGDRRAVRDLVLMFQIHRASEADLRTVVKLFDGYRQFYGQPANYPLAEAFLRDRFTNKDSVVFLAIEPHSGEGLGFVQLYPCFWSVAAQRIWILSTA